MATGLKVILDDNASDFKYSGGTWTLSTLVQWYSGTSNYPAFATDTVFGSFTLQFEGTSIAFIGNTPPNYFSGSQTATVSIDGGTAYNISYHSTPPAYVQWYQSPTLSDGSHTITVSHLAGTAVDMALITVGPNTSLQGKTLIVDDDNSAIQYSGSWTTNTSPFNAGTLPDGFPVGNTTHRSTTAGDTASFRFTGTSVTVYGIFSWGQLGSLGATYTLDGTSIPQTYSVTTSSPQYTANDGEASNYVLFSSNTLAAGDHTLVINIDQIVNQVFMLDYITYTPSFSTLASMPDLPNSPVTTSPSATTLRSGSSSPSSARPSGSSSSVLTNGSKTNGTQISASHTSGPQTSGSQIGQSSTTIKELPIGAIVGGVIGGILIFLLVGFFLFYLRRRRSSDMGRPGPSGTQSQDVDYENSGSRAMEQVSGHHTMSNGTISPFPIVGTLGYASLVDFKRERIDPSSRHTDSSPVSLNTSHPSSSPGSRTTSAGNMDLLHHGDGVPPAYDALSTHRLSTLPPP